MTRFATHSAAIIVAIFITVASLNAIVTVPQAGTSPVTAALLA